MKPHDMLTTIALASAGGYADAASFLLTGSFTGHITGNTVLSAIALGSGNPHRLGMPVLALVVFLFGTATGMSMGRFASVNTNPLRIALPLEVILAACASMSELLRIGDPKVTIVVCLGLALGIQNGVFSKTAGVPVRSTYMTGGVTSLVAMFVKKRYALGPDLAGRKDERVRETTVLGSAWLSFTSGALVSAIMVHYFGTFALWLFELPIIVAIFVSWTRPFSESTIHESLR